MNDSTAICPELWEDGDFSLPEPYKDTALVRGVHEHYPRFGKSKNITAIISGTTAQGRDYMTGILAAAIAIFAFFMVWLIVVIICKCLGYKRVGFFSGHRVTIPPPPPSETEGARDKSAQDEDTQDKGAPVTAITQDESTGLAKPRSGNILEETISLEDPSASNVVMELMADPGGKEGDLAPTGGPVDDIMTDEEDDDYDYDLKLAAWEQQKARAERRLLRIRLVALFSGGVIIVCVILMCVKGVQSLERALESGRVGVRQAEDLITEGIDNIDNFTIHQREAGRTFENLTNSFEFICPNLCANLAAPNCNISQFPAGDALLQITTSARDFILYAEEYVLNALAGFREDLLYLRGVFSDIDETAKHFKWAFYVAAVFGACLALVTFMIMYGIVFSRRRKLNENWCWRIGELARNWFIVPLFIILIILCWAFSMVFVIGSGSAADFCVGSPDPRLLAFLNNYKDEFQPFMFSLLKFYIGRCNPSDFPIPYGLIDDAIGLLRVLSNSTTKFMLEVDDSINGFAAEFAAVCGTDPAWLLTAIQLLVDYHCLVGSTLVATRNFLLCSNWHPMYESIMYNAVCYESTDGFTWISAMQFCIVFFAMILLILRTSFYEIQEGEDEATRRRCGMRCRGFWARRQGPGPGDDELSSSGEDKAFRDKDAVDGSIIQAEAPEKSNKVEGSVGIE